MKKVVVVFFFVCSFGSDGTKSWSLQTFILVFWQGIDQETENHRNGCVSEF